MDKAVIKSCDYCKDPVSGLMSIMNEEYEELYLATIIVDKCIQK